MHKIICKIILYKKYCSKFFAEMLGIKAALLLLIVMAATASHNKEDSHEDVPEGQGPDSHGRHEAPGSSGSHEKPENSYKR